MGLDITAYETITPAPEFKTREETYESREEIIWLSEEPDFPEQQDGLKGAYRASGELLRFPAGSYGGYNRWREELAALVGTTPQKIWHAPADDAEIRKTPFWELINFSDCDGTIGPKTSAKLAKDFDTWAAKAFEARRRGVYLVVTYEQWRAAFHLAAKGGGCVQFH